MISLLPSCFETLCLSKSSAWSSAALKIRGIKGCAFLLFCRTIEESPLFPAESSTLRTNDDASSLFLWLDVKPKIFWSWIWSSAVIPYFSVVNSLRRATFLLSRKFLSAAEENKECILALQYVVMLFFIGSRSQQGHIRKHNIFQCQAATTFLLTKWHVVFFLK